MLVKVVKDLPSVSEGMRHSTLTVAKKTDQNLHSIGIKIDLDAKQVITYNPDRSIITMFLCNYYDKRFKECKVLELFESNFSDSFSTKIPLNMKIRVIVRSNELLSFDEDQAKGAEYRKMNSRYAHEIYLVIVPENTPGLDPTRFYLAPVIPDPSPSTKRVLFMDNEANVLIANKHYEKPEYHNLIHFDTMLNPVSIPRGLELVQIAYYMSDYPFARNNLQFYFIDIPLTSTLTFIDKKATGESKSSFYVYNKGYDNSIDLLYSCRNPRKDFQLGAKNNPNLVTFKGRTVAYPVMPKLISYGSQKPNAFLCLAKGENDEFFFTFEENSKEKFYWNFNLEKDNQDFVYTLQKLRPIFEPRFTRFEVPKSDTNQIFVSIRKSPEVDTKTESEIYAEVVFCYPEDKKVFKTVFKSEMKTVVGLQKEWSEAFAKLKKLELASSSSEEEETPKVKAQREKVKTHSSNLNKLFTESKALFEELPVHFHVSQGLNVLLSLPLDLASVVYLSASEVVYSFVNNFPTRCNPNFDQNYEKLVAMKGDSIWINCEENPAKNVQMTPQDFDADENLFSRGLNQVIYQTLRSIPKSNNHRII